MEVRPIRAIRRWQNGRQWALALTLLDMLLLPGPPGALCTGIWARQVRCREVHLLAHTAGATLPARLRGVAVQAIEPHAGIAHVRWTRRVELGLTATLVSTGVW